MTRSSKSNKQKLPGGPTSIEGPVDPKAVQTSLQSLVDEAQAFAKAQDGVALETASFMRDIEETKAEIARLDKRVEFEKKTTSDSLDSLYRKLAEIADLRREVAAEISDVKVRILQRESKIKESLESIISSRA
jgi:peptidoglycan hydrolase CwlO-like protein